MDFISQDNICDLTRNLGFLDDQVDWLYTHFSDQKIAPTTFTLQDLKDSFYGDLKRIERDKKVVKYFYPDQDVFLTAYLKNEHEDIVHRVEYVSRGKLIRKDFLPILEVLPSIILREMAKLTSINVAFLMRTVQLL